MLTSTDLQCLACLSRLHLHRLCERTLQKIQTTIRTHTVQMKQLIVVRKSTGIYKHSLIAASIQYSENSIMYTTHQQQQTVLPLVRVYCIQIKWVTKWVSEWASTVLHPAQHTAWVKIKYPNMKIMIFQKWPNYFVYFKKCNKLFNILGHNRG